MPEQIGGGLRSRARRPGRRARSSGCPRTRSSMRAATRSSTGRRPGAFAGQRGGIRAGVDRPDAALLDGRPDPTPARRRRSGSRDGPLRVRCAPARARWRTSRARIVGRVRGTPTAGARPARRRPQRLVASAWRCAAQRIWADPDAAKRPGRRRREISRGDRGAPRSRPRGSPARSTTASGRAADRSHGPCRSRSRRRAERLSAGASRRPPTSSPARRSRTRSSTHGPRAAVIAVRRRRRARRSGGRRRLGGARVPGFGRRARRPGGRAGRRLESTADRGRHHAQGGAPVRVVIAEDPALLREGLAGSSPTPATTSSRRSATPRPWSPVGSAEQPDLAVLDIRMPPTYTDEGARAAAGSRTVIRRSACSSSPSTRDQPRGRPGRPRRLRLPAEGPGAGRRGLPGGRRAASPPAGPRSTRRWWRTLVCRGHDPLGG